MPGHPRSQNLGASRLTAQRTSVTASTPSTLPWPAEPVPETATFLGIFRNFAVIFPNSNVDDILALMTLRDYLRVRAFQFVIANMADSKSYGVREARKIATGTTRASA